MHINLDDPPAKFVGRLAIGMTVLSFVLIAAVGMLIVVDWLATNREGPASPVPVALGLMLPALTGSGIAEVRAVVGVLIGAAPLVLAGVCFDNKKAAVAPKRLNGFGRAILYMCLLATVLSAFTLLLGSSPAFWGENHQLGASGVERVAAWQRMVLQSGAYTLAALLGMR